MSKEKQIQQLGMDPATAGCRLRKMILFRYAQQNNLDKCFRCDEPLTIEDFEIDHVVAWLDVDPALFWDLSNVKFSHGRCNRKAARRALSGTIRQIKMQEASRNVRRAKSRHYNAPEGKAWCAGHQQYHGIESFSRSSTSPTGTQVFCKDWKV